jgi:tetratricopeptide (TPR) repeat protein
MTYHAQARYDEAEGCFDRCLEIFERAPGQNLPDLARALSNLGTLQKDRERYLEAESTHRRATKILESVLGSDHPDLASAMNNLAETCRILGRQDKAEPLLRRAIAIREMGALRRGGIAFTALARRVGGNPRTAARVCQTGLE